MIWGREFMEAVDGGNFGWLGASWRRWKDRKIYSTM